MTHFIFSHGNGRITLNQTDDFSCKARLANASKKDTGVWTMILDNGGTKERELKEYRHNILVTSSSKYNSVDGIGLSLTTPYSMRIIYYITSYLSQKIKCLFVAGSNPRKPPRNANHSTTSTPGT